MKCIQLRSIANINQDFIFRLGKLYNSYFICTMQVLGKIIDASELDMSLSSRYLWYYHLHLSANSTKWSNTLKQFDQYDELTGNKNQRITSYVEKLEIILKAQNVNSDGSECVFSVSPIRSQWTLSLLPDVFRGKGCIGNKWVKKKRF